MACAFREAFVNSRKEVATELRRVSCITLPGWQPHVLLGRFRFVEIHAISQIRPSVQPRG
jgi:hypothetical protein